MNVLLIYPEYPDTFWSFKYALRFAGKKASYPPLGLLTVAALLPESWNLKLVDLNVERLKDGEIEWADYVMISAMLVQRKSVDQVLERCRRLDTPVIAGGPLFVSNTDDYVGRVDHLILNEAEATLPRFLADFEAGNPQPIYTVDEFPDINDAPVPRWDLVNIKKYATLLMQGSRGCPFDCDFCDITKMFGRKPRIKRPSRMLAELQTIYDLGWREMVFIVDDNFIGNKVKAKRLLREMIEWSEARGRPFTFTTEVSINLADDQELIDLMVEAGFDRVFIGLETPNPESLQECSKNQNLNRDLLADIHHLQASGLQVMGGYILGFDNDSESIFSQQIKFIQESGVVTAMVGLLHAVPNTRLWHRLKNENRLLSDSTGDNTDGTLNFVPKMDMDQLMEGYRRVIRTLYSPRQYYRRVNRFLHYYNPKKKIKPRRTDLVAFMRTVVYLGIIGNGITQWYYWKMLVKSMLFYRRSFQEAITLMVYGHHFRKTLKKVENLSLPAGRKADPCGKTI